MIDERAAHYFLARLDQVRHRHAMKNAGRRSWLDVVSMTSFRGVELVRFARGAAINDLASVAARLRTEGGAPDTLGLGSQRFAPKTGYASADPGEIEIDGPGFAQALVEYEEDKTSTSAIDEGGSDAPLREGAGHHRVDHSNFEIEELVRAARSLAAALKIVEVAAVLLLAKAMAAVPGGLATALRALSGPRPIVTVASPVPGFFAVLRSLLEQGILLPGGPRLLEQFDSRLGHSLARTRSSHDDTIAEIRTDKAGAHSPDELANAFEAGRPILVTTASLVDLHPMLLDASTLSLDTGYLDGELIARIIEVTRGVAPSVTISDEDCALLDPTGLRMAMRPGLAPDAIVETLKLYAAKVRTSDAKLNQGSQRSSEGWSRSTKAPPATVIQPSTDPDAPRVETLAGYGAAQSWAIDLKRDLEDWKAGSIQWSDLSARLLLSGPPGTGKTSWAKALGNSLQLPLLVSSAADWLTGGHLGDVLGSMDRAFSEAVRSAPAILFIDEIDGLGRRDTPGRAYDDYWISVVNKALQLLDGALRTEGVVVVGATNRPEAMDKALLRAGRLETHVVVPKPGHAVLAAILAQHLGSDLATVLASAPEFESVVPDTAAVADGATYLTGELDRAEHARTAAGHGPGLKAGSEETDRATLDPAKAWPDNPVLRSLVRHASGSVGADIERAVRVARGRARRERRPVLHHDIATALAADMPDPPGSRLRWRLAVHEAAHAVAFLALGLGEVVSVAINTSDGGATSLDYDRGADQAQGAYRDELVLLMAGRAAELTFIGEVGGGSGGLPFSDLDRATALAASMEGAMGYGGDLPLVYHDVDARRARLVHDRQFAKRVQLRLQEAETRAIELVGHHEAEIRRLAKALVVHGSLETSEIRRIVAFSGPTSDGKCKPDDNGNPRF